MMNFTEEKIFLIKNNLKKYPGLKTRLANVLIVPFFNEIKFLKIFSVAFFPFKKIFTSA